MKKPRILMSGKLSLAVYAEAINNAGGVADAKYLPPIDTDYDGLVLCGGSDIDPACYGEAINGAVEIDHERDKVEVELLKAFVAAGKPILGICRGCQLINAFFGGTLHQDLENTEAHRSSSDVDRIHGVTAVEGSLAEKLYGSNFIVNSVHHQAVKALGEGLKVMMHAEDGVIEGFEHETLPIFAVQWHPERICFSRHGEDTVDGAAVFAHFMQMCGKK